MIATKPTPRKPRAATASKVAAAHRHPPKCEADTDHYHACIERMVRAAGEGNFRRCMMAAMDEWIERKERENEQHRAETRTGGVPSVHG